MPDDPRKLELTNSQLNQLIGDLTFADVSPTGKQLKEKLIQLRWILDTQHPSPQRKSQQLRTKLSIIFVKE